MFNASECLRDHGHKTISEHLISKRIMFWSMLFVIMGCTLASPRSVYPQWTASGNDISNTNTGNVGVGTGGTAPVYKLNVAGNEDKSQIRFGLGAFDSGGFLFSNAPTHAVFSGGASWNGAWFAKGISASSFEMNTGTKSFFVNTGMTPNTQFTPTARMHINTTGVGIGTTTPSAAFEVVGPGTFVAKFTRTDNTNGGILVESPTGFNPNVSLGVNGAVKWYLLSNSTNSDTLQFWESTGSFARFTLTQSGTVGIGTTSPNTAYKLDVAGQIRSSSGGFVFPDGTIQTTAATGGGGGTIMGVTAGAGLTGGGTTGSVTLNVGAGTGVSVAADAISVNYGAAAGTAVQGNTSVTISAGTGMSGGGSVTLGAGGSVTLTNADPGSSQSIFRNVANSAGTTQFAAGSNSDSIRFAGSGGTTISFDAATKKVTIDGSTSTISAANISAGQFGQNTGGGNYTFPNNVSVNGNIAAKYQDVAEWVESSEELTPGTVVVLDSRKSNQVVAATQAYDSRVAGVISLKPGIALGEYGEGRVLVATTGRVKLKVDATNGPIQIGDLLVTSDKQGVAMKSVPVEFGSVRLHRPGTIVGKALEPLAQGTGEILVLLSLQ
jgi:hypothetical protein